MTKGVACVPEAPLQPLLSAAAVSVLWAAGRMLGAAQRPLDRWDPEGGGGTAALTLTRTQQTSVAAHCQAHHHNSLNMHTQLQHKKFKQSWDIIVICESYSSQYTYTECGNPLISIAPSFDRFGWSFQGLLKMVNLEFYF